MTPATLAKLTRINRATAYSVGKSLESKGLVAEDRSGKTIYLNPLPPESLQQLIERPRRELSEKEKLVKKAIADLTLLAGEKEYPVPKVRFVEETQLEEYLYDSTQRWQNSVLETDGVWWGFQDHSFVENYEHWIHSTWKTPQSKNKNLKGRVVSNESVIEKKLAKQYSKDKRDVRTVPNMHFTSSLWVAGDSVITIMTRKHPFYLYEIQDPLLAQTMRELCKKLWQETR